MKSLLAILFLGSVYVGAPPQISSPTGGSPKEVVEKYVRMADEGLLLTDEGWNKAQELFVRWNPIPTNKTIYLVSKGGSVGELWIKGDRAEVEQTWRDPLGSIDASLRYFPPAKVDAAGTIFLYRLFLTDTHWELGPDRKPTKEMHEPMQWRLEGPYTMPWTTPDVAIRYVAKMRKKTSDPIVKKNADATIVILKHLLSGTKQ